MSYPAVGEPRNPCEICGAPTRLRALRGGGLLGECIVCGHLVRSLDQCPSGHRDRAYGGEPALDRARLALTHRSLTRGAAPRSVFEVGFGSGALLRRFLDAGAQVGGVDPDQLGVDVDEEVRRRGDLRTGVVEDISPGSVSADLVVGIHVLEHVADPVGTLRRVRTLLAPGGRAVFLTPAGDSTGLTAYGSHWWMLEDPTHVRFFTASSLQRAAQAAGFTATTVDRLLLDSISVDPASIARRLSRPRPTGVLSSTPVLATALAATPLVLAARVLAPRTRATLRLTALDDAGRP